MKHYEATTIVKLSPERLFKILDDHSRLSSHMSKSSWMMGGGRMDVQMENKGQTVGSHIRLSGNILGFHLFLDEVVTIHEPPSKKEWQTIGDLNLLVIGHYRMGFEIVPHATGSQLKVYIDYDLPKGFARFLSLLFGKTYAKWCVKKMLTSAQQAVL